MQHFMYLARILGENQYFKRLWHPARLLGGLSQSDVIHNLLDWLDSAEHPSVIAFRESFPVIAESPTVAEGHRILYSDPALDREIERWWQQEIVTRFPVAWREVGAHLYAFERWSRPVYQPPGASLPDEWRTDGDDYVSMPIAFPYDIETALKCLGAGDPTPPVPATIRYEFRGKRGFYQHLDNHETGAHYFTRPVALTST
jgi:hypothetical protein